MISDYDKLLTSEDKTLYRIILLIELIVAPIGILFVAFPEIISKMNIFLLSTSSITLGLIIISITHTLYFLDHQFIKIINKKIRQIITKIKKTKHLEEKISKEHFKEFQKKEKGLEKFLKEIEREIQKREKEFLKKIFSESLTVLLQTSLILMVVHYYIISLTLKNFILFIFLGFLLLSIIRKTPLILELIKVMIKTRKLETVANKKTIS